MRIFESTEKMYQVLGELFNTLMEHPEVKAKYVASGMTIRFNIHDPEGYIWLCAEQEKVICGEADLRPTIEMSLSGDTCHRFWLQEIKMPVALAKGLIKAKGPLPKVLNLLPILKPAYEAYPEIARKHGIL